MVTEGEQVVTPIELEIERQIANQLANHANQVVAQADPLFLSNSDFPGMVLTNSLFDGNNFLAWSRQLRLSLAAKLKLEFIDGTGERPARTDVKFARWSRCDSMVACWILNSMKPEISGAFIYNGSARSLWLEISERFHQNNGPLIYQLQQEISQMSQGNQSVIVFYNKLKRLWDELDNLNGVPECSCGAMQQCKCDIMTKYLEMGNQIKLMQFLLKLNADYDSVKSQLLASDPLPNVGKAFQTVSQVEKQKQISSIPISKPAAFVATNNINDRNDRGSTERNISGERKEYRRGREKRTCYHCKEEGHIKENCFELVGYPDWYKGRKGKRGARVAANVDLDRNGYEETPLDGATGSDLVNGNSQQLMMQAVSTLSTACQEVMKAFKTEKAMHVVARTKGANFHFAGPFE